MQRTYYIAHDTIKGWAFDKVVYRSREDRPRFHKVEALIEWKKTHKGYWYLTIRNVYTVREMKENGFI